MHSLTATLNNPKPLNNCQNGFQIQSYKHGSPEKQKAPDYGAFCNFTLKGTDATTNRLADFRGDRAHKKTQFKAPVIHQMKQVTLQARKVPENVDKLFFNIKSLKRNSNIALIFSIQIIDVGNCKKSITKEDYQLGLACWLWEENE
ncbi:TPA: hypothetical protein ACVO1H_004619 [Vibrio diabolicus]|nr:hypothetical protein [Vibrio parahaemolyticus]